MTQTPSELIKAEKDEHALQIVQALENVKTVINSRPELWYGGLPDNLTQTLSAVDFQALRIRERYGLPAPEASAPEGTTPAGPPA